MKVMVVEDEKLLLDAISRKMLAQGIEVLPFDKGELAVESLLAEKVLPDAIWLDYYLGDMNGLDFMQRIKSTEKLNKIPVIVVSNSASPDKVSQMLALGANKYLLKAEQTLEAVIAAVKEVV